MKFNVIPVYNAATLLHHHHYDQSDNGIEYISLTHDMIRLNQYRSFVTTCRRLLINE